MMKGILEDQASHYLGTYEEIQYIIEQKGQLIAEALTLSTNFTITAPLEDQFKTTSLFKEFLNANLTAIMIFLAILSFVLIYSLMLSDVDSKTYEYGMLRALGFRSAHLVGLLSLQSLSFSMPGMIFGLLTASVINVMLRQMIFIQAQNVSNYQMTSISILVGIMMGTLIPLFANIYPIKTALGKNLRESLDLNKRPTNSVGVKVQKLEDVGMSLNQTIIAFLLVFIGIGTYYVIPMSFLNQDFGSLFFLLNMLLLMVVIGLTLICVLLFKYLERLLLWGALSTCCRRDRSVHQLILKNMQGHSGRNSKTSIMFTLAIAFLIFASCAFETIASMSLRQAESLVGSDLSILAGYASLPCDTKNDGCTFPYLDERKMTEFLESQKHAYGKPVVDYAFVTKSLKATLEAVGAGSDWANLQPACEYTTINPYIKGVPENYMKVVYDENYTPMEF